MELPVGNEQFPSYPKIYVTQLACIFITMYLFCYIYYIIKFIVFDVKWLYVSVVRLLMFGE